MVQIYISQMHFDIQITVKHLCSVYRVHWLLLSCVFLTLFQHFVYCCLLPLFFHLILCCWKLGIFPLRD